MVGSGRGKRDQAEPGAGVGCEGEQVKVRMRKKFDICVCASGGGGNFQALIDNQALVGYRITKLITDRVCGAVDKALSSGILTATLSRGISDEVFFRDFESEIPPDTDLVVLAGFMPLLPADICEKWHRKIINTHPSLLPSYGGKGMYGVRVQEAVLRNKESFAGCTVHYVTSVVDGGDIILQAKIKVNPEETAWVLGGRVFKEENRVLPEAVKLLMSEAHLVK